MFGAFDRTSRPARARNIVQIVGSDTYSVYHDCRKLAVDADTDQAMLALVAGLNNAAINDCELFSVHAGVVAGPHGVLAAPAASGGGKSTLTAALVTAGFEYVSDEALVLSDEGLVLRYQKPFALSAWSAGRLGLETAQVERLVTPEELGGTLFAGEGQLSDLVLSEFGHSHPSLEPLPRSRAVAALIEYSFNHYKAPERAFRLATDLARQVRVWRLEYDDPIEAADAVAEKLA